MKWNPVHFAALASVMIGLGVFLNPVFFIVLPWCLGGMLAGFTADD